MPSADNSGSFPDPYTIAIGNKYACEIPDMPEDGWITRCRVWGSETSSDATVNYRAGIYSGAQATTRLAQTNVESISGASVYLDLGGYLPTPPAVAENTVLKMGIAPGSTPGGSLQLRVRGAFDDPGTSHRVQGGSSDTDLPASFESASTTNGRMHRLGYEYVAQVAPNAGAWQSPTPAQNAQVADESPTIRGSLPHGSDSEYDETSKVQIRAINTNTGATIYDAEITPTTAEKNGDYFERTPFTAAPGTQVEVDFRHKDTWDAWSAWSSKRTFTILDAAPGVGSFQSPTPAQNSLVTVSTPTISGTTPHPSGDNAYDYTIAVQLKLTNQATGATVYDQQFNTTSGEKAAFNFSKTVTSIAQGVTVDTQFRHQDRAGTWSSWSATRTFTISSGPDKPTISRPKNKVNFVNEAGYQALGGSGAMYAGSYNNTTGAIMWGVRVQVWNEDETTKIVDSMWVARTATGGVWTLPQASFPASGTGVMPHPSSFEWGTVYKVRAAVAESSGGNQGIESAWGDFVTLTTNSFPTAPTNLSPADGTPTATGQFQASVTDPDGDIITAAALKLTQVSNNQAVRVPNRGNRIAYALNAEVSQTSWTSRAQAQNAGKSLENSQAPTFSSSIPNEGNTVKEIPSATLARSTAYVVGNARLRPSQTTADTWYLECTTAGTTSGTNPGYTTPVDGNTVTDGGAVFTYRIPVTWKNTGPDVEHSMDVTGTSLSKILDVSLLTLGEEYQWKARARDATGWGEFSILEPFIYASVPTVEQLAPRTSKRTNLIEDPSAEYAPAATPYWTWTGLDVNNTVERTNEDAGYGDQSWKAVLAASNAAKGAGKKHTIDPTKPVFLYGLFKKASGTTTMRFRLACYTAADAFISNVTPNTLAAGSGVNVPTTWTEYGGIAWPIGSGNSPALPANTAKVAVEILPSDGTAATIYFDAFCLEQVGTVYSSGQWTQAQKWHGYFDGDTDSKDTETKVYYWSGAAGQSSSQGDPILTGTAPNLYFKVTHTANSTARRLLLDRWIDRLGEWRQIHDTGFIADTITSGTITSFPLPLGILINEERYRARIQARDALGISGEGGGAAFDTFYIGPAEPGITSVETEPSEATVTIAWNASSLTALEFGGYEIAREAPGEREIILHREMNQSATTFTDPYPLSGVNYKYKVRVVRILGTDLLQGRYSYALATCDYEGLWFVKDVEKPRELYSAYETSSESMPTPEEDAITSVSYPWGLSRPKVSTRFAMRIRTGSVVAQFYADNQIAEDYELRYEKMRKIFERRKTICILTQQPDKERIFASIVGPAQRGFVAPRLRSITFAYQENSYEEDILLREGT